MECLLVILAFACIPFGWLLTGITLSQLWAWFVIPQFGAAPLPMWVAVGLATLIGYVTYHHTTTPKQSSEEAKRALAVALVSVFTRPIITLIFGYIIYRLTL